MGLGHLSVRFRAEASRRPFDGVSATTRRGRRSARAPGRMARLLSRLANVEMGRWCHSSLSRLSVSYAAPAHSWGRGAVEP